MEKFAEVFEVHGRQILVKKGKDDSGNPKLCIITQIDGSEIDFGVCFDDTPEGWGELDEAFSKGEDITAMATGFAEVIKDCKTPMDVMKALQ